MLHEATKQRSIGYIKYSKTFHCLWLYFAHYAGLSYLYFEQFGPIHASNETQRKTRKNSRETVHCVYVTQSVVSYSFKWKSSRLNIGASYFSSLNGTNGYDNCRINKAFIKELRWTPSKTDTFGIVLTVHPGEVSALETDDVP